MKKKNTIIEQFDSVKERNAKQLDESILIQKLKEGELFGELSLMTDLKRTATVITNEICMA